MHETIRQYAQSKLAEAGEVESIRIRLAAHYLGCARHISSLLDGKEVSRALGQLEVELPNIRAAMESALSRGDPETVLTIASALDSGWYYHGHLDEGRQYLKRALALDGASDIARLDGQFTATVLAMLQGDHTEIDASFTSMCDTANRIGYAMGAARAHISMGASKEFRGLPDEAERYLTEGVQLVQVLDSPRWTSNMLMLLSDVVSQQGDLERAYQLASEALALSTGIGHTWTQAHSNGVLAYVHRRRQKPDEAARCLLTALGQFEEIGDLRGIAGTIAGTAAVVADRKNPRYAAQMLGFARELSDSIGVLYYTQYVHAQETTVLVRSMLNPAEFDLAFALGRTLERAVVLAETKAILQGQLPHIPDSVDRLAKHYRLTRKETEVFRELSKRSTNAEIADACFIQTRTAQDHVQHIMSKLGVNTRWDAAARLDEF
jgi:non-specific serine/threonine protein kinase